MFNLQISEKKRSWVGLFALATGYLIYLFSFIAFNGDFWWPEYPIMFATFDWIGLGIQFFGFLYSWRFRKQINKSDKLNNVAFWLYLAHIAGFVIMFLILIFTIATGNFQS